MLGILGAFTQDKLQRMATHSATKATSNTLGRTRREAKTEVQAC